MQEEQSGGSVTGPADAGQPEETHPPTATVPPSAPQTPQLQPSQPSAQPAAEAAHSHSKSRRPRLREYEMRDDEGSGSSSSDEEDGKKKDRGDRDSAEHGTEEKAVERSPLGRFVRFNRKLGAGSYKTVYLGFDCDTGKEVAWNIISIEEMDKKGKRRITEEIKMLKSLQHPRIIAFINAWINKEDNQVCFITERVTGGSLLSYIRRIGAPLKLKVMRTWCRQILEGLKYLHGRDDPIIHRDLKCDNIFINGNVGEVLIGDLGLSTTLKQSCATSIVGTPDFIAPEVYEEKYGTAVDIYAFGMCLLEMITRGSPYEECHTPAQVYRKVIAGEKPRVLRRIKDEQLRLIVDLCIRKDYTERPTAAELLVHHWLVTKPDCESDGNQLCELIPNEDLPPEELIEATRKTRSPQHPPARQAVDHKLEKIEEDAESEALREGLAQSLLQSVQQHEPQAPAPDAHSAPSHPEQMHTNQAQVPHTAPPSQVQSHLPHVQPLPGQHSAALPSHESPQLPQPPQTSTQTPPPQQQQSQNALQNQGHTQTAPSHPIQQPHTLTPVQSQQSLHFPEVSTEEPAVGHSHVHAPSQPAPVQPAPSHQASQSTPTQSISSQLAGTQPLLPQPALEQTSSVNSQALAQMQPSPQSLHTQHSHHQFEADSCLTSATHSIAPTPREALETIINKAVVEQVVMVIQHNNCKFNVAFDFNGSTDTVIMVAKELQDARIAPPDMPMEDLIQDIENAILDRSMKMSGNHQVHTASLGSVFSPLTSSTASVVGAAHSAATPASAAPVSIRGSAEVLDGTASEHIEEGPSWSTLGWSANAKKYMLLSADIFALGEDAHMRDQVSLLQRSLAYIIPGVHEHDFKQLGDWCDETTKAVVSFQEYHELQSKRGAVDEKFWDSLSDQVKKKDAKESQKRAKREEDRKKLQQVREQRKQMQDKESALKFESMMGICKMNLSDNAAKTENATKTGTGTGTGTGTPGERPAKGAA